MKYKSVEVLGQQLLEIATNLLLFMGEQPTDRLIVEVALHQLHERPPIKNNAKLTQELEIYLQNYLKNRGVE